MKRDNKYKINIIDKDGCTGYFPYCNEWKIISGPFDTIKEAQNWINNKERIIK